MTKSWQTLQQEARDADQVGIGESLITVRALYKRFDMSGDLLDQFHFSAGKLKRKREFVHAINGVDLDVRKGEALCVVGESGCGKSTVARVVMGLLKPSSGEVTYRGERIDNLSDRAMLPYRRKLQMIFQNPYASLNPRKTITQTLEEPLRFHFPAYSGAEVRERVVEVMDSVGVDHSWGCVIPMNFPVASASASPSPGH